LRFLSSKSGITKIAIAILIVVVASAAVAISYYITTQLHSQNASSNPTLSAKPTFSPTPTSTFPTTSTQTPTPITTTTPTGSANPTPTPSSPELTTQEKIRDAIMYYIQFNHPETEHYMNDLVWTGGRVTPPNLVGAETYMYYSQGWNVTINYPVVPNAIYNIVANYSATSTGIPYTIIWKGTWQNETINETSYVFAQ
jgi:hypothetical protein